jgi:hypothetical protein
VNDRADLVFTNGAVYTVDATRRWAQSVAIRGGRIVAVGTDADVKEHASPGSEVVDLRGRMLLPGFQDAHVHPPSGGWEMAHCNLSEDYDLESYRRIIRAYAEERPEEPWVLGGGWSMDVFPRGAPPKTELDALVPDRPVFLTSRDGHSAWVNSKTLELAGITKDTPDPGDGVIEREPDGKPLGTLHEGAMQAVVNLVPETTLKDWIDGLLVAQEYLHSLGITAWQDAIVGGHYPSYDAYKEAASRGDLTARVVGSLWWDRYRGEEQIEEFIDQRARGTVGRFRATTIKIMQDGVLENFTGGVLEPYLDAEGEPTQNRGKSFVDPEALKGYVTRLDAEGFQVHFHAIGDRAVREALDAIEAARNANGMNDNRHHIAHIQVIHPDDLPRFRRLGVVANGQPLWAINEGQMLNLTIPFLGPGRSTWQYPFASLVRHGAILAFGSDWSVSSPNPLWEMHVAVNRLPAPGYPYSEGTAEVFLPEERIDLPTAIHAFTMGSAYVNHLDEATGSIEVGKLADLCVLDRNLFDGPVAEIGEAKVVLTLVEGERVFEDRSFS